MKLIPHCKIDRTLDFRLTSVNNYLSMIDYNDNVYLLADAHEIVERLFKPPTRIIVMGELNEAI